MAFNPSTSGESWISFLVQLISAFTVIFISIGVASFLASRNVVVQIVDRYETDYIPEASRCDKVKFIQSSEIKTCIRTIIEDLIFWMRTAALPTFRKLYGKIEADLQANEIIQVTLQNNYNTYSFGGKKKLVLSTANWPGGMNDLLGIAYLTVGGLCFFLAMAFTVIYLVKPRQLGDPSYLSWNRTPAGH